MKSVKYPVAAAFLGAVVSITSGVHAEDSAIKKITSFISDAYGYYTKALDLYNLFMFGPPPTLKEELDAVKADIISEIQYFFFVELDAAVQSTFDKYRQILDNPGQLSANQQRILYLTGSSSSNDAQDVFNELERIMSDARNVEQSYRLAAPFNALSVIMGHAMGFYPAAFQGEPGFSWFDYHDHFRRTLAIDYRLVGARGVQCWPGYDPGAGNYQSNVGGDDDTGYWIDWRAGPFTRSWLWVYKIGNTWVNVGTQKCATEVGWFWPHVYFNPAIRSYDENSGFPGCNYRDWGVPGSAWYPTIIAGRTFNARADDPEVTRYARFAADISVAKTWRADAAVSSLRQSISAIMKMGGGNDAWDPGNPDVGQFVDPWVDEPLCGANNPWAYPAAN